jgi:PPOX class probable F420-dependent enzyme
MSQATIDAIGQGKYLSLTTFKRDGTAVATPVWVAAEGDRLLVWTQADSGKAKRLRNSGRVLIAPCDSRGRLRGEQVPGSAKLLDEAGTAQVERAFAAKFGTAFRFFRTIGKRRAKSGHVGVEVRLNQSAD